MASLPIFCALGIHTTTPQLGLCFSHPERGIKSQTWDLGRDMSAELHEYLASFVQPHDLHQLQFIAVAVGPGGFTSTRLGVVTARTLAQQLNIPLFGVSSLAAYVWQHSKKVEAQDSGDRIRLDSVAGKSSCPSNTTRIAVQMPARRGQVFGAVYDIVMGPQAGDEMLEPTHHATGTNHAVFTPQQLVPHKADHVIDAAEWTHYLQTQLTGAFAKVVIEDVLGYTVSSVIELATLDYLAQKQSHWATVYPFYGQSPV